MAGSSVDVQSLAADLLTEKQLEAFRLECAGWGMNRIARYLGITKGAAVARIDGAHLKLARAGVRMDEFGQWTLEEIA